MSKDQWLKSILDNRNYKEKQDASDHPRRSHWTHLRSQRTIARLQGWCLRKSELEVQRQTKAGRFQGTLVTSKLANDHEDLKIDSILALNQNFKQCVKSPTRLNPPAILDIIVTDLFGYYQDPVCEKPLDVDSDKLGSSSDHLMVVMEPKTVLKTINLMRF